MTRVAWMPINHLKDVAEKGAGDISLISSIAGGIAGICAIFWPPARKAAKFAWGWIRPYLILPILMDRLHQGQEESNQQIRKGQDEAKQSDQLILDAIERNTFITQAGIDLQPFIFWTASPEGKRTYTSAAWRRITWRDQHESLGDEWQQVIDEDDRDRVKREWKNSVDNRLSFSTTARYVRTDGERIKMNIQGEPRFKDGKLIMFAGTCKPLEVPKP